ncbi:MAG: hypothetical protein WC718_07195 [Phycisphaerales bacterium]|jgi:hypothetical protein
MTTLDHDTGVYNVEGSVTAWMAGQLLGTLPPLALTATVNVNHPEQALAPPQWSIHHLPAGSDVVGFQGGNVDGGKKGRRRFGIAEVNCWTSRSATSWRAQLAQMGDAVTRAVINLLATGGSIPIYDFYTSAGAPAALTYRIVIERAEEMAVTPDPNPDIERKRILVYYHWTERN